MSTHVGEALDSVDIASGYFDNFWLSSAVWSSSTQFRLKLIESGQCPLAWPCWADSGQSRPRLSMFGDIAPDVDQLCASSAFCCPKIDHKVPGNIHVGNHHSPLTYPSIL